MIDFTKKKLLENRVKETYNSTFGTVNLTITYLTIKSLNGTAISLEPKMNNIVHRFKFHFDGLYIGISSLRSDLGNNEDIKSWR